MKAMLRLVVLAYLVLASSATAQPLTGQALVQALQMGGLVVIMRHGPSPAQLPKAATAEPGNTGLERQLSPEGQAAARAMGQALQTLKVPVGEVLVSPKFRAMQTARLAGLPEPKATAELDESIQPMGAPLTAQANWTKARLALPPKAGTDVFLVSHSPNVAVAVGLPSAEVAEGEAFVFRPDGKGGTDLIGRIKLGDWPALAAGR